MLLLSFSCYIKVFYREKRIVGATLLGSGLPMVVPFVMVVLCSRSSCGIKTNLNWLGVVLLTRMPLVPCGFVFFDGTL